MVKINLCFPKTVLVFPLKEQSEEDLTVHGLAVVVAAPGFYNNSGRVDEVERNDRESDRWLGGLSFIKTKDDLLSKQDALELVPFPFLSSTSFSESELLLYFLSL